MRYEMYNKLFSKILDSSIWLEDDSTRLVWLTFLAVMDQDGFAQFASVANLAHRARVPLVDAQKAVARLEGPDSDSSDPDNEGRRIERMAGGWMVLNAEKYRELVTREVARARTRDRVRKHREAKAGNAAVTVTNEAVTPSETDADPDPETKAETTTTVVAAPRQPVQGSGAFEPASLPRYHMKHAVCSPSQRICLLVWQFDALAVQWGGDKSVVREPIERFIKDLDAVVGNGPLGDWRWLQAHFTAWMGQQGRTAIEAPKTPVNAKFTIQGALDRRAATERRRQP